MRSLSTSYFPSGLAIDGGTIYWVEADGQRLRKVATDGTQGETVDSSPMSKTSIAIDATRIAWTSSGEEDLLVDAVATDGEYLYWSESENGVIVRMRR